MDSQRILRYADDVLGGPDEAERSRLAAMADVCDPTTTRVLDELRVAAGWRCLEVGAGGGSIAAWLADRVAGLSAAGEVVGDGTVEGEVVATDIDTRHLAELAAPQLTVLRHDITRDPLPGGRPFDLVHARFVLEHLREREAVLDRLRTWLKPGGVLVLESLAGFPVESSPNPAFREAMLGIEQVLAKTIGTDSTWARGFPEPLRSRGLVDVGMSVHLPTTGGGNASARCWTLTLNRLRPRIRDLRLASDAALDEALDRLADPSFFDVGFATAIAWGWAPG
ncbi:bifunctional 2-polyprenyl-6-hydroxyphenol methylase/3-demethylubiquinol 3-O-methyltransferase UbiG [Parafrankia sp. EUN1f]|uniref:class I SAM-dependent methyltransferase n=1 Tax=Parafrankia sp. EUN1f TaxID=102897 RepID=UPI0001C4430A|nr:class I SAM-dependent methyltransferase [Parafrankia sp. EUN1f]EFC84166.1 Methyltransferase type 12 [Parafrankia sp. EUN1f]